MDVLSVDTADVAALGSLDFWLDKPLRVTVIIIGAFLLNFAVRIIIRRTTIKIADGETAKLEKL